MGLMLSIDKILGKDWPANAAFVPNCWENSSI